MILNLIMKYVFLTPPSNNNKLHKHIKSEYMFAFAVYQSLNRNRNFTITKIKLNVQHYLKTWFTMKHKDKLNMSTSQSSQSQNVFRNGFILSIPGTIANQTVS